MFNSYYPHKMTLWAGRSRSEPGGLITTWTPHNILGRMTTRTESALNYTGALSFKTYFTLHTREYGPFDNLNSLTPATAFRQLQVGWVPDEEDGVALPEGEEPPSGRAFVIESVNRVYNFTGDIAYWRLNR